MDLDRELTEIERELAQTRLEENIIKGGDIAKEHNVSLAMFKSVMQEYTEKLYDEDSWITQYSMYLDFIADWEFMELEEWAEMQYK